MMTAAITVEACLLLFAALVTMAPFIFACASSNVVYLDMAHKVELMGNVDQRQDC
jgi:hypothetical protein